MAELDYPDPWTGCWDTRTPAEDPQELRAWQLEQAWALAERAATSNPYYRDRLSLPEGRSVDDFATLPVTTKDEVVTDCSAAPPYGTRATCSADEVRHFVETSGTSGRGQEVYPLTASEELATFRAEAVGFAWAGVTAGSRVLLTLPVGTRAAGIWYYHGLRLLGANVMSVGAYRTDQKVELLRRYGADLLIATPSYLQRLTTAAVEGGVEPDQLGVGALLVSGEGYGLTWAHAVQQRWGATLYEQYGCTERAFGWACPGGAVRDDRMGVLHFPPELGYCEVVDPQSGQQVASGEEGELIVTPFIATSSPLVRFATRDRVRWLAPGDCDCGRPLAGIEAGGVQRYDDMMKIRGINIWPLAMDRLILGFPEVADYRAVVHGGDDGREAVVLQIETDQPRVAGHPDDLTERLGAAIRTNFGLGVDVTCVQPGAITTRAPDAGGKVRRWTDERVHA